MREVLKPGLFLLFLFPLGAAAATGLQQSLQAQLRDVIKLRPLQATVLGLTDAQVGARVEDRMNDYSSGQLRQWRRALRGVSRDADLLVEQGLPLQMANQLQAFQRRLLGAAEVPFGYVDVDGIHQPYIVNHWQQPLLRVPGIMIDAQAASTPEQAGDYLRRLWAFDPLVDGVLGKFNADADVGWLAPEASLRAAVEQLESFIEPPPQEHPLVSSLIEKIQASGNFSEDDRARIANEAIGIVARVVYPGYENAVRTVRRRLAAAGEAQGVWALPLGERYYSAAVLSHLPGYPDLEQLREKLDDPEQILEFGVHQQRWSRDKAVDYAMAELGLSRKEAQQAVLDIAVAPGAALIQVSPGTGFRTWAGLAFPGGD